MPFPLPLEQWQTHCRLRGIVQEIHGILVCLKDDASMTSSYVFRMIQADYRERIRKETQGLSAPAARAVSDTLQAERDNFLNNVESYAAEQRTTPTLFAPFK